MMNTTPPTYAPERTPLSERIRAFRAEWMEVFRRPTATGDDPVLPVRQVWANPDGWYATSEKWADEVAALEQDVRKWQERATLYGQAGEVERLRVAIRDFVVAERVYRREGSMAADRYWAEVENLRALTKPEGKK